MSEILWPVVGVVASGVLLWWFWKPRRKRSDKAREERDDLWRAMDDGADPTE